MTIILSLISLILISVAVWQLTKIFELSKPVKSEYTEVADYKDNDINGKLMFLFLIFLYALTIFSFFKWGDVILPESASLEGEKTDTLLWFTFSVIFVVQTITQAFLYYFAFKYRGNKKRKAFFFPDSNLLEGVWTVIPAIALAGIILYGLMTWTEIMTIEENDEALVVEIYAQQFNWKARYAGEDGVLGDANVRFLQDFGGKNLVGIDSTDPNGDDDIVVQELHLPVNRQVVFRIRSQDVLHSMYMPHFRAQMNAVPGMITQFAFTPNVTTTEMRLRKEVVEYQANHLDRVFNEDIPKKIKSSKGVKTMKRGQKQFDEVNEFNPRQPKRVV